MRGIGPRGLSSSQVSDWHNNASPSLTIPARSAGWKPAPTKELATSRTYVGQSGADLSYSGLQTGDLLLATHGCWNFNSPVMVTPVSSGLTFTQIEHSTATLGIWYSILPDSTNRSVTFDVSSADTYQNMSLIAIRGVNTTTPLDGVTPQLEELGSNNSFNVSSITTNTDMALVVIVCQNYNDETGLAMTQSGWTNLLQYNATSCYNSFAISSKALPLAGASGTVSHTQTVSGGDPTRAVRFVLRNKFS